MAVVGLKDLYYARVTETSGVETFATPKTMAEAMTAELSITTASATLYADDALREKIEEFISGTIKLGTADLTPTVTADLLGQYVDDDEVTYAGSDNIAPYFSIGFRAAKSDGTYRYVWLYKVKFAVPDEKFQSKGESITFNTPTITGTFYALVKNGLWKSDAVLAETSTAAKGWFTTVREIASE